MQKDSEMKMLFEARVNKIIFISFTSYIDVYFGIENLFSCYAIYVKVCCSSFRVYHMLSYNKTRDIDMRFKSLGEYC